jgi:Zn-dependent protease with chaperone function
MILKPDGALEVRRIEDDSVLCVDDTNSATLTSRLGNTPRVMTFTGECRFTTRENDLIDEFLKTQGTGSQIMHLLESHLLVVVFASVITCTLLFGYLVSGLPYTARVVAEALPEDLVATFGAGTLEIMDEFWLEPSELSLEEQDRITDLFSPYQQSLNRSSAKLEYRSGIGPNALVLPDGTIVFTDGLINLVENDNELIAVLLHEIGHLNQRHLIRRTIQDSMLTIMVVLITGDIETADFILGVPTLLVDMAYSRDFETEADEFAIIEMQKRDIDLGHFANVMNRLESHYKQQLQSDQNAESENVDSEETTRPGKAVSIFTDYLTTHPATIDRVRLIEKFKPGEKAAP